MAIRTRPLPSASAPVIVGVDPHKRSHTAAVLDERQQVVGHLRVAATRAGIRRLQRWAERWPERRWAIENASGLGRSLAQVLLGAGETVLDVPPTLSRRVRLLSGNSGRKTDAADAVSTARAAAGPGVRPIDKAEGVTDALRLLSERRQDLMARRTQCLNRLHVLLADLLPGQVRRDLTPARAAQLLRQVRSPAGAQATRRGLARDVVQELRGLERAIGRLDQQLEAAVAATGTTLPELHGIGVVLAAVLLGRIGDIRRFPTAAQFAAYCGVAPLEASSGDVIRHRLSRLGDRRLNAALHIMAVTQAGSHPLGRAYYLRKQAEGHSKAEALRCLKRRLADVVYRRLRRDAARQGADAMLEPPVEQKASCRASASSEAPTGLRGGERDSSSTNPTPPAYERGESSSPQSGAGWGPTARQADRSGVSGAVG